MKPIHAISAVCILLTSVSCDSKKEAAAIDRGTPPAAQSDAVRQVLAAKPSGEVVAIPTARATVKPGDVVTLKGQIMGNRAPFVEGRSAFILGDTGTLTACTEECGSPWDNCCDTPEAKKAGTALVQIVDASGQVLKESLEGQGGLEKLAHVTVTGKVAEGSSPELLLVNATAISTGK